MLKIKKPPELPGVKIFTKKIRLLQEHHFSCLAEASRFQLVNINT
jgi:hypothetical protein